MASPEPADNVTPLAADPAAAGGATITPYPDGPLIVRGDFRIQTPDGREIVPGRSTVALCRCGQSGSKPFCDGTHKVVGFCAAGGDERSSVPRSRGE
ncbi:MAG: CDGSH iron-sulfur domain-containing protein [Actinomycetales bacterium]